MGRDAAGRTIIQLAVDDRALERLMTFDADAADLEDGGDDEPDADDAIGQLWVTQRRLRWPLPMSGLLSGSRRRPRPHKHPSGDALSRTVS